MANRNSPKKSPSKKNIGKLKPKAEKKERKGTGNEDPTLTEHHVNPKQTGNTLEDKTEVNIIYLGMLVIFFHRTYSRRLKKRTGTPQSYLRLVINKLIDVYFYFKREINQMDNKGDKDKQRKKASRNSPKRSQLKKKESKQNIEPEDEDEKITQDKISDEQEDEILNEKLVNPDQIEEIDTLEVKAEVDD